MLTRRLEPSGSLAGRSTNVISKDFLQKTTISASRLREIKARAELVTAKDVEARKKRRTKKEGPSTKKLKRGRMRKKERGAKARIG